MLNRYKVTYTNLNNKCLMNGYVTKKIFSESLDNAKQLTKDLYTITEDFKIISIKSINACEL